MTARLLACAALCAGLIIVPAGVALAAEARPAALSVEGTSMAKIATDRAPALVTIKFVLVASGPGGDQEIEAEAGGLVIDPKGLVLVSNLEMGGSPGRQRARAQTKDIKVLIGDDTEGVPAKLIGRDSELELAWVQIDTPADTPYSFVDLSKGASVRVGETLVGLDRMNKYFDRTLVAFTTSVGGLAKKPRNLIIPVGGKIEWIGLPMFNLGGELAGVSVVQMIGADEEDPSAMRNLGRQAGFDRGLKVLPVAEIAASTARAVEAFKSGKGLGMEEPKPETPAEPGAQPIMPPTEPTPEAKP
jgi:S1-C subfamily serine protease